MFTGKKLAAILLPLIAEQFLTAFVGMVDVLMVSFLGEAAVSGVSLVDSINHLIIQFLFALTAGGTVICARSVGAGDRDGMENGGRQLLFITETVMLPTAIIFILGRNWILAGIFGTVEEGVMSNALTYAVFTAASFPFLALFYSSVAVFRAVGNTRVSMLVSVGMNALNIIGNAIGIFILHMGVAGVALPTLVARVAGAVYMFALLQRNRRTAGTGKIQRFRPDRGIVKDILGIGIPGSIESLFFNIGKVMLQSLVSTLGTASIAAYAVASNLAAYLYLPGNALGAGMMTVVGQCYGAGEHAQARNHAKKLILLNYIILLAVCPVIIVGRGFLVGLYHLSGQSFYLASGLLLAHTIAMILWPPAFLPPYYFRSSGHARFPMGVAIIAMAVFRLGLAHIFVRVFQKDVLWIWYAMFVDWVFRDIVFSISYIREGKTAGIRKCLNHRM